MSKIERKKILCMTAMCTSALLFIICSFVLAADILPDSFDAASVKSVTELMQRYTQLHVAGDAKGMYELLSPTQSNMITLADFTAYFTARQSAATYTGIAEMDKPKLVGPNLAAAIIRYSFDAHKGKFAGEKGTIIRGLYAQKVDAGWKIIDLYFIRDKSWRLKDDVAGIAGEILNSWLWNATLDSSIIIDDTVRVYDKSDVAVRKNYREWASAEVKRLEKEAEIYMTGTSELISLSDERAYVRSGFSLTMPGGSAKRAAYELQLTKVGDKSGSDKWKLLYIKPLGISNEESSILENSVHRAYEYRSKELINAVSTELTDMVDGKIDKPRNGVSSSTAKLSRFIIDKVESIKMHGIDFKRASAEVAVTLFYDKDVPPNAVSGKNIIKLKLNDDLKWVVSKIVLVK